MQVAGLPPRIVAKIHVDPESECWEWGAYCDRYGHGRIQWGGRSAMAHRVVYHLLRDSTLPIHPGLGAGIDVLDHIVCDNPPCVNPTHLAPCSNRLNLSRRGGSSKLVGVDWYSRSQKWRVRINLPGEQRRRHIGYYDDEQFAGNVYRAAAAILTGGSLDGMNADAIEAARSRLAHFIN